MKLILKSIGSAMVVALLPSIASAQIVEDDFEIDTSGDYTVVVDGTASDGSVQFAYDYIADSIPLAPRSTAGDVGGLKFTANNSLEVANVFTAFHNTTLPASVAITVDMYLGVTGIGGTTEYGTIGAGGDGVTPNRVFSSTLGSGDFIAIDGDGDVTSDYRWTRPDGIGGLDIVNGVAPDPSYLAGGSNNTHQLYQDLFPTGTPRAGSPGNLWTTVEVVVHNGLTRISLDGTPIIQGPSIAGGGVLPAGLASIGYGDVFTSLANPTGSQFGIFDNLTIDEGFSIPEPATLLMACFGACSALAVGRRQR